MLFTRSPSPCISGIIAARTGCHAAWPRAARSELDQEVPDSSFLISTDNHHTSQEFRASVGAQWPFLSDPERTVQQDLDIQEYTDPEHDPMIPHTLVLKPGLVIHRIYNGYWFWGRPSTEDLRQDLRAVTREIRPDWDLSTPGLRQAWDAGDLSPFHGWNKRSPERIAAEPERVAR